MQSLGLRCRCLLMGNVLWWSGSTRLCRALTTTMDTVGFGMNHARNIAESSADVKFDVLFLATGKNERARAFVWALNVKVVFHRRCKFD